METFKVLIADDETEIREILENEVSSVFEGENIEFFFAADGLEAVDLIKEHGPDLVLTDMKMPRMNGVDLIRYTRQIKKEPIIIMISAFGDRETLVNTMRLGAFDFFEKPFSEDQLKICLLRVKNFIQFKRTMFNQIKLFLQDENVREETIEQVFEFVNSISKERYTSVGESFIKGSIDFDLNLD
ncbi:response regulator [Halobacteriovorax sp. HLS]|uniref:response regulator n=1 Tax=Halobacteriovorax sp. HLS TaxID=2234000 RepID=UPI0013E347B7|nr:response regulator [Halobacteriovorax sp. HLS]